LTEVVTGQGQNTLPAYLMVTICYGPVQWTSIVSFIAGKLLVAFLHCVDCGMPNPSYPKPVVFHVGKITPQGAN